MSQDETPSDKFSLVMSSFATKKNCFEKKNGTWLTTAWAMIAESLSPLLSYDQSIFNVQSWGGYVRECTNFVMADSDSTDKSKKIEAALASGEFGLCFLT